MESPRRTVVITGANSGIGLETAIALATGGWRVVIACRDAAKADAAVDGIRTRSGHDDVASVPLDLADLGSVRRAASSLAAMAPRVDVLVNNAGLILSERRETVDGFEATFATNHLGHFLLTTLLRPQLEASEAAQVINVSSVAHGFAVGGLDFDDLQATRRYNGWLAYGRSKLANIYFTQELARRWAPLGITSHAVHPGTVHSGFGREGDTRGVDLLLMRLAPMFMITPVEGARTTVWLATSPIGHLQTGGYWTRCRRGHLTPWARRASDARRLWELSERYVADGHP